ncbi:MAG: T9SS type A sorting domain-containing protein [Flavobacteriaceae bacterium]|nr:T9SS type A sorting domain-containing protein [Flavobacteriaceae bacterium]
MKKLLLLLVLIFPLLTIAQNYTSYFTGDPLDVTTNHQYGVCLMGGATEHDEAMKWFLQKADGGDVVVLRASGSDGYNDYFFSELGVTINSVETLVIHNSAGGVDPYVLQQVANAEAIWFAGGNQYNYVSYFKDNDMEILLNQHINNKQAVIGGTSAGMAIMGGYYFDAENGTVTSSQALANPYHNKVSLGFHDFLEIPLLENVITDTHYDDPDRRGRHTVFLARFTTDIGNRSFGIACNEYTAVCIEEDGTVSVYGDYPDYEEYAYFLQANCVEDFQPENCSEGNPLTWMGQDDAIRVYKVPGTNFGTNTFNISDWKTGSGGVWENWFVDNGLISFIPGENPNCDLLGVTTNNEILVSVYPNPFSRGIYIDYSTNIGYILYNIFGKELKKEQNFTSEKIDLAYLSTGIYFLKITSGNKTKLIKLIKE